MSEPDRFVSVDIETAGPNPGQYSMLSIGACLVIDPKQAFYIELQPINNSQTQDAYAVHGLKLEDLTTRGQTPSIAMEAFQTWLNQSVPTGKPIFVAFNAPFDWMFVNDYFHRYLGKNPFGHSALDIKAFYMGRFGVSWAETTMARVAERMIGPRQLSHHALEDAHNQAEIFRSILAG